MLPPLDERALILLAALLLDALVGDPDRIWSRCPHPVVLMGRLIGWLDGALNQPLHDADRRRMAGAGAVVLLLAAMTMLGLALGGLSRAVPLGWLIETVLVAILLAGRSLVDHVRAVADALETDGLAGGRTAVARIVGRDPERLDEAGVCRAAIESCAENFADGVVAPAAWYLVAGLPGLLAYKALNTADSMIGYRNETYRDFGFAAARLDDLANWIPARLSGLLIAAGARWTGGDAARSLEVMWRDADKHASPNAGWPEAAMAGALGIALAGPRSYGDTTVDDPWLNPEGRRSAVVGDITTALRVVLASAAVQAVAVLVLFLLTV